MRGITTILFLVLALVAPVSAQPIGTDLASINLCLYGDCEARGSFAADPFGWPNPATIPVGTLPHIPRGVFLSAGHFFVNAGRVDADVSSFTATLAYDPVMFQVNGVMADGRGAIKGLPGAELDVDISIVRLAAAIDLTRFGAKGLSLGLIGALPIVEDDIRVRVPALKLNLADIKQRRTADLTFGLHWRAGESDWFMAGAYMNPIATEDRATVFDPRFGFVSTKTTTNALFSRVGVSILPAVPLHIKKDTVAGELFHELRLGADIEYRNLSVPAEGKREEVIGYFGADFRLLPDRWNPAHRLIRPYGIAGVDTLGGWGAGLGIYGHEKGWLNWFSCNLAYSSRPLIKALGERLTVAAITCSATVPF